MLHPSVRRLWVPSQVATSTSCGLKRKLQTGDASDVFDRYSQLCARNVFPRYLSCDWDNVTRMPTSTGEEIILDFEHLAVRLASTKRDLERVLLKPRHFRDDRYGCESSGAGDEPCAIAHDGFLLATPNTTSFKPASSTDIGVSYAYDDLGYCDQQCRHYGAAFWTTRDKCGEIDIPKFKIRLYNGDDARGYELPASNTLGAIFPLLFIYGQLGFHTELKLRRADGRGEERRVTMLAYYAYRLHPMCVYRVSSYSDLVLLIHKVTPSDIQHSAAYSDLRVLHVLPKPKVTR
ncbi:hypothetical protein Tco_0869533 [Tanacetum coccineum]